jgi:hypothetical protein
MILLAIIELEPTELTLLLPTITQVVRPTATCSVTHPAPRTQPFTATGLELKFKEY